MSNPPLPIGTETKHGTIVGIHTKDGERSYFIRMYGVAVVLLCPEDLLETETDDQTHSNP